MYDLVSGVNVAETRCLLVDGRGPQILARLGQHHHLHRRLPDIKVNLESKAILYQRTQQHLRV